MKKSSRKAFEIGAGAAALAAAAAAAYLLSGKEGAKRRAKVKSWAMKARTEVARNIKTAKKVGAKEYARLVDQAVKHYGSMEDITGAEIARVARDLKTEWKKIEKRANTVKAAKPRKPAARRRKSTKRRI